MFTLSKALALLSVALLVSGRAAPHARGLGSHHALAARLASPVAAPVPVAHEARVVKSRHTKRQNRCRARQEQQASSQREQPTVLPTLEPPPAVVNPAAAPTTSSPPPPPPPPPPPSSTPPPPPPPPPAPSPPSGNNGGNNGGSNNGPSFMFGTQSGQGTFYDIGLGACGRFNSGNDRIAAVSWRLFDNYPGYSGGNPNNNPICGRRVNVQFEGRTTSVAIVDRCEACAETDLDFSPTAFGDLADFSRGRVGPITWQWAD